MPGTLYVVSTPIGNLEDITYRAVRILREVSRIACEDTRQTQKLLQHYEIRTPTVSYHEHNEAERTPELLDRLEQGESIALVSDAGTPLISDPGYRLLSQAAQRGLPISPIPGPSALLAALAASGLTTDRFLFGGFLPAKSGQRQKALEQLRDFPGTVIFYESPHRIQETLSDIHAVLGSRPIVAGREMTKLHEEFLRGDAQAIQKQLAERPGIRGEFTLVIGKGEGSPLPVESIPEQFTVLLSAGVDRMDAIKQIARARSLSKREVYEVLEREKP